MKDNSGHSEGGEVPKLEERLMKEPTSKAIKDCTNWLIYCLDIGWQKEQLYYLQKIWWEHHDEKGNLTSTGSVADPKPDNLQWPSKCELPNHSEKLEAELAAAKESIKELIPIAEDRLFSVPVKSLDEVNEIVRRAKALLDKQ